MKTLKEWLSDQGEDPDFELVQEQASMMMTRVAGLLNSVTDEQKKMIVKQMMAKLAELTTNG